VNLETKLILLVAYAIAIWAVFALRNGNNAGEWSENSVRCVKLGGNWHEPHGISPGWCGK
jgi:hypothetical protein